MRSANQKMVQATGPAPGTQACDLNLLLVGTEDGALPTRLLGREPALFAIVSLSMIV